MPQHAAFTTKAFTTRAYFHRLYSPILFNATISQKLQINTYSDNVQCVVTDFADFCVFVMHQIDEVSWSFCGLVLSTKS